MPPPGRRNIVRDEGFEASLQPLFADWHEAEAFIAAAEKILALDPEIGSPWGDGTWLLPMAPVRGADVWLFYTFYETVVVLLEVRAFMS